MKIKTDIRQPLKDIIDFLSEVEITGQLPDTVTSAAGLDNANHKGCLTFLRTSEANRAQKTVSENAASVFLVNKNVPPFNVPDDKCILRVKDPNLAFVNILEKFFIDKEDQFLPEAVHPTAIIAASAKVDKSARIGAYVVIGENVEIGSGVIIHPHVVLYHNVKIGDNSVLHSHSVIREHSILGKNCIIQPGAVLAADGFGYIPDPSFGLRQVPQVGILELKDRVEVGANSCLDRATAGTTLIGHGSKIDNLVQVGHNVQLGSHVILCGQVAVGGSSNIAEGVVLGGQVGIGDHINICKGVRVGGGSAVTEHIAEPGDYTGTNPITSAITWRRIATAQKYLPEIYKSWKKSLKKED